MMNWVTAKSMIAIASTSDVNWLSMIQLAVETEWDLIKLSSVNDDKLLTLYSVVDVVLVGVVSIDVDSLVLSRVFAELIT